jgi:hypothetical protein
VAVPEPEPVVSQDPAAATAEEPAAEGTDEDVSLESILEDLKRREGRSD